MDEGYAPLKGEIELWREKGSSLPHMSGRSWTRGVFVLTNLRLLFIRSFDPPFMGDRGADHILWQFRLEEIMDVSTFKPSSLIPVSVRINTMDRQYILNLNSYSPNFLMERIVNTFNRYISADDAQEESGVRHLAGYSGTTTLNDFSGDREIGGSRSPIRPPIPDNCFACGSPIDQDNICWLDRNVFQCPVCGSRLKVR
ncbi:MAG: hypothetical protein ACMUIG_06080 [Thermoplasmatota archaeon]